MAVNENLFRELYDGFQAPISRFECGSKCAPHNNGEPVCCSTQHAVPVVDKAEWRLLRSRSELWHRFKPYDAATRQIAAELPTTCMAVECKGARHCERENRSLSCRAFPFFPYIDRAGTFIGLSYYWIFEDRCWVISNLQIVDRGFIDEFVATYEKLMAEDRQEFEGFRDHSLSMRRVFSRWNRAIPLIGRDAQYYKVMPRSGRVLAADPLTFPTHGPYKQKRSERPAAARAEPRSS
jgi:hypothetical protein